MSKLPLVEGVLKYIKQSNALFCMPGHKGGRGFKSTEIGQKFYKNLIKTDITEVDGMDNLHHPEGIIDKAQQMLSHYYGSKKSYFLVNGSTSGNLTMIFSCFEEGDKIIVERNCHRSILNGIIMRKLNPIYIKNKVHKIFNAPLSIDEGHFIDILDLNKDAKGIIITYPNYYGVCCNLKLIIEEAHKRGMLVLVDSAHGAHFGVHPALPRNAVSLGGDLVVMSAHKTLSSFTQTSFLHVGNRIDTEKVDFYVSAFLSTSPSYMLMCSMDYSRYFLEEHGQGAYDKLIKKLNFYKTKINKIKGFHIIGTEDIDHCQIDVTRYVLHVDNGLCGYKLYDYLLRKKLQPEMCDGSNLVLLFSPFTEEQEIKALYEALLYCDLRDIVGDKVMTKELSIPKKSMLPYKAFQEKKKLEFFKKTEGKVCGEAVVPYPPGIPIVLPGEIISKETIEFMEYYINNKVVVLGVDSSNRIKIVCG